jgi:hypothetical protein
MMGICIFPLRCCTLFFRKDCLQLHKAYLRLILSKCQLKFVIIFKPCLISHNSTLRVHFRDLCRKIKWRILQTIRGKGVLFLLVCILLFCTSLHILPFCFHFFIGSVMQAERINLDSNVFPNKSSFCCWSPNRWNCYAVWTYFPAPTVVMWFRNYPNLNSFSSYRLFKSLSIN